MAFRSLILLCLLLVPTARAAQTDRTGSTVALTITADTAGLTDPADIRATEGLPADMRPLLRYALYRAGWFASSEPLTTESPQLAVTVTAAFVPRPVMTHSGERRYFTTVRNYLSVRLAYRWTEGDTESAGIIEQVGKRDWLRLDNPNSRRVVFSPTRPEPSYFTLQRAVHRLYEELFGDQRSPGTDGATVIGLPVLAVSLVGADPRSDLIGLAQNSLVDQCGLALRRSSAEQSTLDSVVARIELRPPRPDYALGGRYEELGNAYPGADTITVVQYPLAHPDLEFWRSFYSRLTLVHELAHTLGAVHVSDATSVMNHGLQRYSDDRFDPLNRAILDAAVAGEFDPGNAIEYVSTLSRLLQSTGYRLADFPPIFSIYLSGAEKNGDWKRMEAAIGKRSYVLAAEGYTALQRGDRETAAERFRRAIKDDPHLPALWYYLAKSTSGLESTDAMQHAANLGYFMAEMAIHR